MSDEPRDKPPALPITLLAASGFLSAACARVIDPLLHVIAVNFSTTISRVSIVVAAFTLPYGLLQIVLGPLGDRFGKLRVILVALTAFAVATALCALARSLPMLALLRVGAGAASAAIIPIGMAYIGDAVPYARRQVTLSRFLNGVVLAQLLAGPIGGVFGEYLGWRGVFLLLSAGALAVAAVLALRIRHLPDRRNARAGLSLAPYAALARHPFARLLLLGTLFDGMLLVGCFPFLAPYMHERFFISYAHVGLVLACFGLGALAYTRLAARLVPLLGEANMVTIGGLMMAAALLLAMASGRWEPFILVQAMLGMGFYLLHGVMQARATELLPNARATAVSTFAFALFIGQSLGALGMGQLIGQLGYRTAFQLNAAAIVVLAFALRWLMGRRERAG